MTQRLVFRATMLSDWTAPDMVGGLVIYVHDMFSYSSLFCSMGALILNYSRYLVSHPQIILIFILLFFIDHPVPIFFIVRYFIFYSLYF